jgi:hypothetical protein
MAESDESIHRFRRFTQIFAIAEEHSHLICENLDNLWTSLPISTSKIRSECGSFLT